MLTYESPLWSRATTERKAQEQLEEEKAREAMRREEKASQLQKEAESQARLDEAARNYRRTVYIAALLTALSIFAVMYNLQTQ